MSKDSKPLKQPQSGTKFYFKHPDWIMQQDEKLGPSLFTVLFELAMSGKPVTKEEILEILTGLDETEEDTKAITELVLNHKDDIGEIIWINSLENHRQKEK